MSDFETLHALATEGRLSRRDFISRAVALGAGTALGYGAMGSSALAQAADVPKKGGTLRIGMDGGSASDSLDPRTYSASIAILAGLTLMNGLVEIGYDGKAKGELLESWETKPGATTWVFNVRKGIEFTSGKKLDADDILYSLSLHMGDTRSSAKAFLKQVTGMKKLSSHQIEITLGSGDADFPTVLSDYHFLVVPNGFTDWSKPDGTGAYALETFNPGVRIVFKNKGNYWKPGRGNFDAVQVLYINDKAARTSALKSGEIDAANRLDPRTVTLLARDKKLNIVRSKATGYRLCFDAQVDKSPYDNSDLRLALKYGIDRQKIVDTVFKGYASVGNDNPVDVNYPDYNKQLAQRPYDPDKAAFHFKKAGLGNAVIELQTSEGAWDSAVDCASLFQESLKAARINLNVKRVAADGYWDNIWRKQPFTAAFWTRRPNMDLQLTTMFQTGASWNDTNWKNPEFDKLLLAARVELDEQKRKEMYYRCQELISSDGGMICFAIADYLDGYAKNVHGNAPHPRLELADNRIAETGWFA